MKVTTKLLAVFSAVLLLAACSTEGSNKGGASGSGLAGSGAPGTGSGELAPNISDRVFFEYDSSVVASEGQATLQKQAEWLKKNPSVNVSVEGHCDERGTREYNLALGERRATAAKQYLVTLGVAKSRIHTISYGKERPAVVGSDESAWGQNRRAVTVIANQ